MHSSPILYAAFAHFAGVIVYEELSDEWLGIEIIVIICVAVALLMSFAIVSCYYYWKEKYEEYINNDDSIELSEVSYQNGHCVNKV